MKCCLFLSAPPPLCLRENLDGDSPNVSPLWHLNQSFSSMNMSSSSNGHQNSPSYQGASASPSYLSNPHHYQPPRHHSITSPTSMLSSGHGQNSSNKHDINQQKIGNINVRGHANSETNVPSPIHPVTGSHHRADHFTFSPNHISADSSTSAVAYGGHGESNRYQCNDSFVSSPVSSATSPPSLMPVNQRSPSHLNKIPNKQSFGPNTSQPSRLPSHSASQSYSATSPMKNSSSSRDNRY